MVNTNVKTPIRKRKSLLNTGEANATPTPKKQRENGNSNTPGNNKNNATPGNPNKTPKATPGKQVKTPKPTPGNAVNAAKASPGQQVKTPKPTPAKNQGQKPATDNHNTRSKKNSESKDDSGSPKKLKMFSGTSELSQAKDNKVQKEKKAKTRKSRVEVYGKLKEKVNSGDKDAVAAIEEKIKSFESRQELSKTAKRKLKLLQKLKREVTGEKVTPTLPPMSLSKKRRERKKNIKAQHIDENKKGAEIKPAKGKQQKQQKKPVVVKKQTEEDEDEESSEYEVETEIQPGKIIKTKEASENEEESDEEDEESGEEEEESGVEEGEEEEESDEEGEEDSDEETEKKVTPDVKGNITSKKQRYVLFVGNIPYDTTKEDLTEHFKKAGDIRDIRIILDKQTKKPRGFAYVELDNEIAYEKGLSLHHTFIKGRRINVLYTAGRKKQGEAKKSEVKAKNLKLHAMRQQGQLAGSVKQNQKRSARRAKQNAAKVNNS